MSDVLARLMRWMETSDIGDAHVVFRDAITEIAGLRARLHEHRIAAQRLAELSDARQQAETGQPVLTDAEQADLQTWLAECLRQCSTATEGGNEELAERWQGRAARAVAMLERLGGER